MSPADDKFTADKLDLRHYIAPVKAISALFVSGLVAASFITAAGAAPHDASREHGLQLAEGGVAGTNRLVRSEPRDKRAFSALLAGDANWRGIFDAATDVPSRLWGGSIYVAGANASATTAERAARSFIASHLDLMAPGAAMGDLQLVTNVEEQGIRTVAFLQRAAGMPVLGGQLSVSFKNDRLFLLRSQALPHVAAAVRAPLRNIDDATATAAASLWISQVYGGSVASAVRGQTAILPIVRAGQPVTYHVVATVTVDAHAPRGRWDVYVDAASGKPVARRQLLRFGTGTVRYNAPERYPGSDRAAYAVPFANYTVNGSSVQANASGVVSWSGTSAANITPSLSSEYSYIDNAAGSLASFSQALATGGIFEWASTTTEFIDAQISAFVHVNIAKRYALSLDPDLDWTKQQIPVVVNEDGSCNAYSTGDDIHFLQKDSECENTARLADVVYHEFGHSFHYSQKLPGVGDDDGAMSEGVSDYYAATLTGDPGMGRGFFNSDPASALRHVDPANTERSWPDDLQDGYIHENGLIIAGTLWDLRKAAIAEMGESAGIRYADEVYLAILRRGSDMPSAFAEALAFDDDDGNIGNGTPNFCMLVSAFGAHGLAAANSLLDIGVPQFDGTTVTVQATPAETEGCPAPTVTKAQLEWKLREGEGGATLDMTADGNDYAAQIPTQNPGSVVRYQVSMTLSNGNTVRLPRNAVDPYYEYYVGAVEEVYCTDFEVDPGWTTAAIGANNSWTIGAPSAGASNGEPTSAYEGSKILTLGLGQPYKPDATYTASAPIIPIDTTRYAKIRVQYQRWLGVEDSTYDSANILVGNTPVWTNKQGVGTSNHNDAEWRFHDVDITAAVAAAAVGSETNFGLQVGVNLKSDEGLEMAGWALDNFCVVGVLAGDICTGDDCIDPSASDTGCCSANQGFASPLLLALAALGLMFFRRRRA